jgi:hypothetical protein
MRPSRRRIKTPPKEKAPVSSLASQYAGEMAQKLKVMVPNTRRSTAGPAV